MNRATHQGSELAAIARVVATVEHAQRNELVEEFVSLFREDAIWTTGGGKLLIGRDAIAAFTQEVLPGAMEDLAPSYEIAHVLFIRPDVAAVKVRQRYLSRDGESVTELDESTPLYVMSKEDGQWLLRRDAWVSVISPTTPSRAWVLYVFRTPRPALKS